MLIALLDEYRKATIPYKQILSELSLADFEKIEDKKTDDKDCKSIQTITSHIIRSGYTYSSYINSVSNRTWFDYTKKVTSPENGIIEIDKMLDYTEDSCNGIWNKTNEELENTKFKTRWNVTYDVEQLLEHSIVHILRHRRQVEKFLNK